MKRWKSVLVHSIPTRWAARLAISWVSLQHLTVLHRPTTWRRSMRWQIWRQVTYWLMALLLTRSLPPLIWMKHWQASTRIWKVRALKLRLWFKSLPILPVQVCCVRQTKLLNWLWSMAMVCRRFIPLPAPTAWKSWWIKLMLKRRSKRLWMLAVS